MTRIYSMPAMLWAICLVLTPTAYPQALPAQVIRPGQPVPAAPRNDPSRERECRGMIVRQGRQYLLKDFAGGFWKIDNDGKVRRYSGKPVSVDGRLDEDGVTIHIDSIRPA
jgi:hypothetical protein